MVDKTIKKGKSEPKSKKPDKSKMTVKPITAAKKLTLKTAMDQVARAMRKLDKTGYEI